MEIAETFTASQCNFIGIWLIHAQGEQLIPVCVGLYPLRSKILGQIKMVIWLKSF